ASLASPPPDRVPSGLSPVAAAHAPVARWEVGYQSIPNEGRGRGVSQVRRDHDGVGGGALPSSLGVSRGGDVGASDEAGSRLLAPELDPDDESGPEELGRFLAEAGKLPAETRAGLAGLIVKEHGRPLRALVDASCPPGSARRLRLATALAAHTGAPSTNLPPSVAEDVIAQTLASLGA